MNIRKIISILAIILMFTTIISIPTISSADTKQEYKADKEWTSMQEGDIIYFDKTGLGDEWNTVFIHLWGNDGNTTSWPGDSMEKVEGSDTLFKYVVESGRAGNNMLIFNNGIGNNENQTIDLGFIENGFVYKINDFQDGKRIGYWYLYDKSTILSHLEDVKKYQEDKKYYTENSYKNLDELIEKAADEMEEIRLEAVKDESGNFTGKYYISIAPTMNAIYDIIDNLEVNIELLENKINDEESNLDEYKEKDTPNSVDDLEQAIEEGKEVLQGTNITVEDIKNAIKKIDDAVDALQEKADKTKLKELLDEAENIDESMYTEDSVNNLKEIVESSQEIYNDDNVSQDKVDDQVNKMQDAINKLKAKDAEKVEENNEKENDNKSVEKTVEDNNKPTESKNKTNNYKTPKTGDTTVIIFGSILVIAVIAFIVTFILSKKRKNK